MAEIRQFSFWWKNLILIGRLCIHPWKLLWKSILTLANTMHLEITGIYLMNSRNRSDGGRFSYHYSDGPAAIPIKTKAVFDKHYRLASNLTPQKKKHRTTVPKSDPFKNIRQTYRGYTEQPLVRTSKEWFVTQTLSWHSKKTQGRPRHSLRTQ